MDPQTRGIVFWSEPFIMKRDGEEIAVLLVDTQGEFDKKSSKKRASNIFAINMMLSSTVIYNVSQKIPTNVLESLEFSVMYAKAAKERGTNVAATERLLFLVRDWPVPSQHAYGLEGGDKYLDTIWHPQNSDEEANDNEIEISEGFAKVECCLMPHPGSKVHELKDSGVIDYKIKIGDIDRKFLTHVRKLADHLLSPGNLIPKPMNGRELLTFTLKCFHNIKTEGKLPKPLTYAQGALEVRVGSIFLDCITRFVSEMTQKLAGNFVPWTSFEKLLEAEKERTHQHFQEKLTFGNEAFKREHKVQLTERLEIWTKKFKKENLLYERQRKANSGNIVTDCIWTFILKMDEVELDLPVIDHEKFLDEKYQQLKQEALQLWKSKISDLSDEEKASQQEILLGEMNDSYDFMKLKHLSRKERVEHSYSELASQSLDIYEEKMREGLAHEETRPPPTIDRIHKSATKKALHCFDEEKVESEVPSLRERFRGVLKANIERSNAIFRQGLETKLIKNTKLDQIHREYDTFIREKTENRAVSSQRLRDIGKTFSTSSIGQMATSDIGVDNWSQEVLKAEERNDQINCKKKEKADSKLFNWREHLIDAVIHEAEKTISEYQDPGALQIKLTFMKQEIVKGYKESINQSYCYEEDFPGESLQRLEEVISGVFTIQVRRCERYEPMAQCFQDIQQIHIELKYIGAMTEVLKDKWMEEEDLASLHADLVERLVPDTLCEETNPNMKFRENQCKEKLHNLYEDFKLINVKNMPFYRQFRWRMAILNPGLVQTTFIQVALDISGIPLLVGASGLLWFFKNKALQEYVESRTAKLRQHTLNLKVDLNKFITKYYSHENPP